MPPCGPMSTFKFRVMCAPLPVRLPARHERLCFAGKPADGWRASAGGVLRCCRHRLECLCARAGSLVTRCRRVCSRLKGCSPTCRRKARDSTPPIVAGSRGRGADVGREVALNRTVRDSRLQLAPPFLAFSTLIVCCPPFADLSLLFRECLPAAQAARSSDGVQWQSQEAPAWIVCWLPNGCQALDLCL